MKTGVKKFKLLKSVEAFYTGGSVQWSADGKTVFTVCGNVVNALNIEDDVPSYIIGNPDDQVDITCAVLLEKPFLSMTLAYTSGLLCRYLIRAPDSEKNGSAELSRRWKSTHSAPILVMKYNNNGSLLATGSADFLIKVWNVETQNCIASLKGPSGVSQITFLESDYLLAGYSDGSVNFFSLRSDKRLVYKWKLHSSQIVSILLSNKKEATFLSRDQTVSTVSLETYGKLKVMPVFEPIECGILVGHSLFTVGEEGVLKHWESEGTKLCRSTKVSNCRLNHLFFNKIRSQFLLVSSDFNLYLVNERSFLIARQYVGFNDEVFAATFAGDDKNSLLVATNSHDIRLYNTITWSCQLIPGHTDSVLSISVALWDPNLFASSSKDNSIMIWKLRDNAGRNAVQKLANATGHTNNVTCIKFSKMSKNRFILSVSHDLTLKLWSLNDLSETNCLKLNASSTLVAHSKDVTCLDVSSNDRLCVTGSMDKTAKLWHIDTSTMQLGIAGTLPGHHRGIWDVRFCDASQVVGTCSGDCCIRIFSVISLECLATLSSHSFAVLQLIFINHGKHLVSVDSGGLFKIWDVNMKDCITTIEAHDDKIWTLVASNDESKIVTGGGDGRIRIWEDVTEKQLEEQEVLRVKKIQDDQTMLNLMKQERFSEALSLALTLEKPYNCFAVISELLEGNSNALTECVARLTDDQLLTLLEFTSKWNTNSRTTRVAQEVLNRILRVFPPESLLRIRGFGSFVETLIPYTKRHVERLSRTQENISFLDFVWSQMRLPQINTI